MAAAAEGTPAVEEHISVAEAERISAPARRRTSPDGSVAALAYRTPVDHFTQ
jgi:hypothetical protein